MGKWHYVSSLKALDSGMVIKVYKCLLENLGLSISSLIEYRVQNKGT